MNSKVVVGALLLIVGAVGFVVTHYDVMVLMALAKEKVDNIETLLIDAGPYAPLLLFTIYLVTTVFMLPLWGFHTIAGYIYGTVLSSLLITTTQAICAGAAFLMSRHVVGPYIRGFLERKFGRKFAAIDKAVSEQGLKITLLLRLSPIIPFGMNNYVCGCTNMKVWEFVVGTWFGVLPGTTAYCNIGALGKTALDSGTTNIQKAVMVLGLVAALAVIKILSDLATNALKEAGIDDDEGDKEDDKKD